LRRIKSFYNNGFAGRFRYSRNLFNFVKKLKKILRIAGMVMLMVLASFGVGLMGGVPIPINKRRENAIELHVELKESEENKGEELIFKNQE
jgi:hypothetical protein